MEFLHSNRVIYRDLKPHHIGFGVEVTVRLFDFGLARIHEEGERKLTGCTGSARYMALEVARSQAYSFPADGKRSVCTYIRFNTFTSFLVAHPA